MRKWLKEIRENRGFTHQQVADAVGISRCFYTQIESMDKTKGLSPKTAMRIGEILNFDWVWFYDERKVNAGIKACEVQSRNMGAYQAW